PILLPTADPGRWGGEGAKERPRLRRPSHVQCRCPITIPGSSEEGTRRREGRAAALPSIPIFPPASRRPGAREAFADSTGGPQAWLPQAAAAPRVFGRRTGP